MISRRNRRRLLPALAIAIVSVTASLAYAQETVVVATRVVYPGEVISTDAIEEVPLRRKLKNPGAVALDPVHLEGKVARRTLLPGRMIPVSYIRDAYLVETGSPVQIMYVFQGLEISVSGVPLQSGAAGDVVRVRNADSGAVFSGTVMADGTIRVSES